MVVVKVVVEPGEDSGEKDLIIEEQKVKMVDGGKRRWCWWCWLSVTEEAVVVWSWSQRSKRWAKEKSRVVAVDRYPSRSR